MNTEEFNTDDDLDDADEGSCATCIHGVSTDYAGQYFYFCKKYDALIPSFSGIPYCVGKDWECVS